MALSEQIHEEMRRVAQQWMDLVVPSDYYFQPQYNHSALSSAEQTALQLLDEFLHTHIYSKGFTVRKHNESSSRNSSAPFQLDIDHRFSSLSMFTLEQAHFSPEELVKLRTEKPDAEQMMSKATGSNSDDESETTATRNELSEMNEQEKTKYYQKYHVLFRPALIHVAVAKGWKTVTKRCEFNTVYFSCKQFTFSDAIIEL